MGTESNYKRTLAGSVGAGVGAIFSASGRTYYIIEHKTTTAYHNAGDSDKIIVDQIELGRDSSCQIRFDESCETVSRKHAAIVREGEGWKIIPLSQTNATYVNSVPVQGEKILNSGDEIRLSSHGPVMGFIIPQGPNSLVKSIGMTERMNLFRKQALAPYKKGLWTLGVILSILVLGFAGYAVWSTQVTDGLKGELEELTYRKDQLQKEITKLVDIADKQKMEIEKYQSDVNRIYHQIEVNDSIKKAAEEALASANAEEKAEFQAKIDSIKEESEKARKNAAMAISKIEKMKAQNEITQQKQAEKQAELDEVKTNKYNVAEQNVEKEQDALFANIEDCNSAVYYIKMDKIAVYEPSGSHYVTFDMSDFVGGTGFLLEDGRFVTARRVIEPWLYYTSVIIGQDRKGYTWTLQHLKLATEYGWKVEGNFTAYSPANTSFKFTSDEMTKSLPKFKNLLVVEPSKYFRRLFGTQVSVQTFVYDSKASADDWATLGKREQLNVVEGLKFSASASLEPESGEDVIILGYPHSDGFSNSLAVNPELRRNTINSPDLNDVNVIELATKRFYQGADGAPVLQQIDGVWTVIGILGHTDKESDRDFAAPIANINR